MEKVVSKLLPVFPERKASGVGKPEEEATCEHGVHVFMTVHGYATNDRRRVLLDKATPLCVLPRQFGRELQQSRMTDDYGFVFSENDLDQPLWKFSHNCTLSVAFVHTHIDEAKQAVERAPSPGTPAGAPPGQAPPPTLLMPQRPQRPSREGA